MYNKDTVFIKHYMFKTGFQKEFINGYCVVHKFIDDYTFVWGLSVCGKSVQYNKKIAREQAIIHMENKTPGFSGTGVIGECVAKRINSVFAHGKYWKKEKFIPDSVIDFIKNNVNRYSYSVSCINNIVSLHAINSTTSIGIRNTYGIDNYS